jgi:hypothetical protein
MGRKHFEVKPKLLGACNMVLFLLGLAVALRSAGLESYLASPPEDAVLSTDPWLRAKWTTSPGSNSDHLQAISILVSNIECPHTEHTAPDLPSTPCRPFLPCAQAIASLINRIHRRETVTIHDAPLEHTRAERFVVKPIVATHDAHAPSGPAPTQYVTPAPTAHQLGNQASTSMGCTWWWRQSHQPCSVQQPHSLSHPRCL